MFFHTYDHLSIPCLADIFAFANAHGVSSNSHKYLHLEAIVVLSHFSSARYSLFTILFCFSSLMPVTVEMVHPYVSIHIANTYVVLSDSNKYFDLVTIFVLSHL